MPPPKLVWHETIALPWFTKEVETRIFWYRESRPLTEGGFDPHKRVAEGHYETLAIPAGSESSFNLSQYRLIDTIDDLQVYERL